jgi:diaminohydroxyphosphoribosylaminopyrimidine deaminase/5-amino-6-(5-phosphoribosylamino)uracil reductase
MEVDAMRRALALAEEALGATSPNPPVGCVVLDRRGRRVGEGFTAPPGGPHAEVVALRRAGERARAGTAVVTLEPCNHHGRTPPCTQALLEAGVARVVYAVAEPQAFAAGGAGALRAAGVEVEPGVLEAEASRGNEAWLTFIRLGRAFVTWLFRSSLDGRLVPADDPGDAAGREALAAERARLRRQSDAVLVSSGGEPGDDAIVPVPGGRPRPPLLRVSVRLEQLAEPVALLRDLGRRGVCSLLVDGDPELAGRLVAAGLVDRIVGYLAPLALGGGGLPALAGPGAPALARAHRYRFDEVSRAGADVRIVARLETNEDG